MSGRIIAVPFAALALIAAAPVPSAALAGSAQGNSSADSSGQQGKAAKPERKICKNFDMSGSHIPERLCLTRAQWREFEAMMEN